MKSKKQLDTYCVIPLHKISRIGKSRDKMQIGGILPGVGEAMGSNC